MNHDKAKENFVRGTARDQGYKQVAKFLMVCEETSLKSILPFLTQEELICIIREVLRIKVLTQRDAKNILKEFGFGYEILKPKYSGGIIKARNMLNKSLDKDTATRIFNEIFFHQKHE